MKIADRYMHYALQYKREKIKNKALPIISEPFSEQDIIVLQDLFLTNGFHELKVKDIDMGRNVVETFLPSLNYYQSIGCLAIDNNTLPPYMGDMFYDLNAGSFLIEPFTYLENYFLNNFDYDFLIVEQTITLKNTTWLSEIKQHIIDLEINKIMPIIVLHYNQQED